MLRYWKSKTQIAFRADAIGKQITHAICFIQPTNCVYHEYSMDSGHVCMLLQDTDPFPSSLQDAHFFHFYCTEVGTPLSADPQNFYLPT